MRATFLTSLLVASLLGGRALGEAATAELAKRSDGSMRRAAEWLLKQQKEDGTFGGPAEVGKAALVLSALLASPDAKALRDDARVKKAVAYVVSKQQEDGSINTPGEQGLANYQTAAAISALAAFGDPAHKPIINKAKDFLLSIQHKEGLDAGGFGYNSDKRADLSNTQFTLEALRAAGLKEDSEAFQNCLKFLQRCQNRSESNDQPWATNDGSGIYYPGSSKAGVIKLADGKVIYKGYGSMTYALLRGYILVGLKPDDPRVQAAQKWITENYTLEQNPGMEGDQKLQGILYYYMSMAKALSLLKTPTLDLPNGTKRLWAKDLAERLISLQDPQGFWINREMRWMENDPILATAYVLQALSECRAMLAQ
ncbi:MAG: terpene cyclase/mutase family protein [Planctomycetes bacterium]|nr:terpene cyclase/mutase family protein [Planctomycetota bacterium]